MSSYARSSNGGSSSSSLNPLRAMAKTASRRPIETITIGFCIVTLAYFQLLHAVKHSEFLHHGADGWSPAASSQDPAAAGNLEEAGAALLTRSSVDGTWKEVAPGHSSEAITLILNRVVVTLDSDISSNTGVDDRNLLVYPAHSSAPVLLSEPTIPGSDSHTSASSAPTSSIADKEVRSSLQAFEKQLIDTQYGTIRFQDVCYKLPSSGECFFTPIDFTAATSSSAKSAMLTVGLQPSAESQEWSQQVASSVSEMKGYAFLPLTPARKRADTGLGLSLSAFPQSRSLRNTSHSAAGFNEEEARSVRWMLYAARAFVMRFYALARVGCAGEDQFWKLTALLIDRKPIRRISSSCSLVTCSCI